MTINELVKIVEPFIAEPIFCFTIENELFSQNDGRKIYNNTVRKKVEKKSGVYVWVDTTNNEIVYVGMAGTIKADGTLGNHTIQERLTASRYKHKITGKDVMTNDYVKDFMFANSISSLKFYIIYTKEDEPAAYIEATVLYHFYKINNRLPKLNNSF